jgi:hypothetical protein
MRQPLLRLLIISALSLTIGSAFGMTPKYPYDPINTECNAQVVIIGEAFILTENDIPALRLQADLSITENPNIPECASLESIKHVELRMTQSDQNAFFSANLGKNITATGVIKSGDATDLDSVIFTVESLDHVPEKN